MMSFSHAISYLVFYFELPYCHQLFYKIFSEKIIQIRQELQETAGNWFVKPYQATSRISPKLNLRRLPVKLCRYDFFDLISEIRYPPSKSYLATSRISPKLNLRRLPIKLCRYDFFDLITEIRYPSLILSSQIEQPKLVIVFVCQPPVR